MSARLSNTPINRPSTALLAGLIVGLVLCILLAWLPLRISLSHFVFEDLFYYLRIARSIIKGNGSSFDGIHSTNGFHPLWMLVSISLVWPFEPGSTMPVHLLLSVCALFHVLTAYVIYKIVLSGSHRTVAVIAALMWLFNYNVTAIAMCGLETSLFAFLVITTVYNYVSRRQEMSAGESAKAGLMVGISTLARFDGALLGLALAADQFYLALRRKESLERMVKRIAPMSLIGSMMMIPWVVWSWEVSGTIFPNSHKALTFWIGSDERFASGLLRGFFNIFASYAPEMGKIYGLVPIASLSLLLFLTFCAALLWGREKGKAGLPLIVFVAFPIAHGLYYASEFAPLNRYLYVAHMVVYTGIMTGVGCWLSANRKRLLAQTLGVATCSIIAVNLLWSGLKSWNEGTASVNTHNLHWTMFEEAMPWIKENVRPEEKVGSFNCGIYGYFSGRTVVNLDGVINDSVLPALAERRLIPYLYREQIDYVVDWEATLDAAFRRFGGLPEYRQNFRIVKVFEQPWGPYSGARLLVLRVVY